MNILHIRILDMLQTEQKFNKSAPDDRKKTCYLSVFSEKLPAKTDDISYKVVVCWLVWFYGMSTIVGYLMPNLLLYINSIIKNKSV